MYSFEAIMKHVHFRILEVANVIPEVETTLLYRMVLLLRVQQKMCFLNGNVGRNRKNGK